MLELTIPLTIISATMWLALYLILDHAFCATTIVLGFLLAWEIWQE